MKTFETYAELTTALVEATVDALGGNPAFEVEEGYSNQSCSSYVNVLFLEKDEDGDYLDIFGDCKVRFSDHGDRYGSDKSFEFNSLLKSDDLGNVSLLAEDFDAMVGDAVLFVRREYEAQQ